MPIDCWGRTWLLAGLLFVAVLAAFEYHFRCAGFVPVLADDASLWCLARSRLEPYDARAIALLGSSRMQLDMSVEVLDELRVGKPVQLAVTGSECLPALDHLSRDPTFVGTVICEIFPGLICGRLKMPFANRQAEYVRHYETRSAYEPIETQLRMLLQSHCVSRLPELGLLPLIDAARSGRAPLSREQSLLRSDRCVLLDPNRLSPKALRDAAPAGTEDEKVICAVEPSELDRGIERLEQMVERIQARGGRVVFIRMPSTGKKYAYEQAAFPRAAEWDPFAARSSALCIHFEDDPVLAKFRCPDGSHIAGDDAREFTTRVAELVFSTARLQLPARSKTWDAEHSARGLDTRPSNSGTQ